MMATHLTIIQGTPFRASVKIQRRNLAGELVPMDLTGSFVHLQARQHINSLDTILDLSSTNGGIIVDEQAGSFTIQMSSAQTSALIWRDHRVAARPVYQCEVRQSDGETIRVLDSSLTIDPEVVR